MYPSFRRLILCLAACTTPVRAQQAEVSPQAREVHAAFRRAFNTGTPDALRDFVRDHFRYGSGPAAERAVDYWLGVRLEVGALELVAPTREPRGNRVAEIFWYRGLTTGAWPGIEFTLDTGSAGRVRGYGVNRAVRPAIAPVPPAVAPDEVPAALGRYFRAATDSGHFSGAVVVTRNGRTVFEGAYGPADVSTNRMNSLDTPFRLASVTKMFTGVAILQLMDRGLLSLDDPVSKFIPEYPASVGRQVTVRQLLTHSSGIELDGDSAFNARVSTARSVATLLALQVERLPHVLGDRLAGYTPPRQYDYTNEGIDLLAAIVERASGLEWRAYLAEHVFRPAGMTRSGADFLQPVPGIPVGYSVRTVTGGRTAEREPAPEIQGPIAPVRPAGSGYATARDMVAFVHAMTDGTLLRPATASMMMSPQIDVPAPPGSALPCRRSYGFTAVITECARGGRSAGHTGGTLGQSTVVNHFPESGYTVVILSNYDRVTWWAEQRVLEMLGLR